LSWLGLGLLLLLSGLFSGSETALFSLPRNELREARRSDSGTARAIVGLLGRPRRLLVTVLLCNTVVNVLYFATSWTIASELSARKPGLGVAAAAAAFVALLLFGEIVPKAVAVRFPGEASRLAAFPLIFFTYLLAPARVVLSYVVDIASTLFGQSGPGPRMTTEELRTLVELSEERGFLDVGEGRMIAEAMRLRDVKVREVMVPRVDMVVCDVETSVEEFLDLAHKTRLTIIPVVEGSRDDVVGLVLVKEMILSPNSTLRELARPVYFVPEVANLEMLLEQFRERGMGFAVAVDEFGGTAGIVALEDVLEVVVGEILDEFDEAMEPMREVGRGRYVVAGGLALRELSQALGADFESEVADTVAGFLAEKLGRIPTKGDVVENEGFGLRVTKTVGRRVVEVEVTAEAEEP
jgi:putative hemolysin